MTAIPNTRASASVIISTRSSREDLARMCRSTSKTNQTIEFVTIAFCVCEKARNEICHGEITVGNNCAADDQSISAWDQRDNLSGLTVMYTARTPSSMRNDTT